MAADTTTSLCPYRCTRGGKLVIVMLTSIGLLMVAFDVELLQQVLVGTSRREAGWDERMRINLSDWRAIMGIVEKGDSVKDGSVKDNEAKELNLSTPLIPDHFDASLTLNDYSKWARRTHQTLPPSPKWLEQCVSAMENNTSVHQPWNNFDMEAGSRQDSVYRLGDCIRACDTCSNNGRRQQAMTVTDISWYYGEMACTLVAPAHRRNYEMVEKIFHIVANDTDRTGEFVKPDPEVVVIHIRLGDVIEDGRKVDGSAMKGSAPYFLVHGGVGQHPLHRKELRKNITLNPTVHYQKSIFSVRDYLDALHEAKGAKVVIVGGSHIAKHYKTSKPYVYCLGYGLAFAGLQVELRLDQGNIPRHPDSDFYYMSHAKKFILSAGGFSQVVGHMVVRLGGEVLQSAELLPLNGY